MNRLSKHLLFLPLIAALGAPCGFAQQKALTWQEVRDKFEAANPSLHAGQIGIDESKANETTAYLRPNPNLSCSRIRSIRFLAALAWSICVLAAIGDADLSARAPTQARASSG